MNQGNARPSYNEIKEYIRKLLGDIKMGNTSGPLESFNSLTREVFIKAYNQKLQQVRRVYEIPNPKENPIGFRAAWVDVFLGCLSYYKQKLEKEGTNILETENAIIIDNEKFTCNNLLEYIDKLELVSKKHDQEKKEDVLAPAVSVQSVTIGSKELENIQFNIPKEQYTEKNINESRITEIYQNIPTPTEVAVEIVPKEESKFANTKLASTFPKGNYQVSSIKFDSNTNAEYDMHIATEKQEKTIEVAPEKKKRIRVRKTTDYAKYRNLENQRGTIPLISYDLLSETDINELKESSIVFVSGTTSNKEETAFYENIELLKQNHVPIAAFISGKATSTDKVAKEAMKIMKMCEKTVDSGVICYEVNNDQLREMDNTKISESLRVTEQLADILQNEGYFPEICIDSDIREKNTFQSKYPVISRVTSKELDDVAENEDLLVMHPASKYDQFMFTERTKYYINSVKNINTKTPSKAA